MLDPSEGESGAISRAKLRGWVLQMAVSPDGRTLAVTHAGPEVELWDLSGEQLPKEPTAIVPLQGGRDLRLLFLPDGTLVTGGSSGVVEFWKVEGKKVTRVRELRTAGPVEQIKLFQGGQALLLNGRRQDLTFRDLKTLSVQTEVGGRGDPHPFPLVCVSPDGTRLATHSSAFVIQVWDPQTWKARLIPGQQLWPVRSLAFTPDGHTLLTASRSPQQVIRRHKLSGSRKEETLALQSVTAGLRFWDPADGRDRLTWEGPEDTMAPPDHLTLSPDGRTLAAGGDDGSVHVWDRESARLTKRLFVSPRAKEYAVGVEAASYFGFWKRPNYPENVHSLAFSPDGRLLAAAGSGGLVVWDTATWQDVWTQRIDKGGVAWVAFSPDGDLMVPLGGQVQFLDPRGGGFRRSLGAVEGSPALCAAFSPSGRLLMVGRKDGHISVWDMPEGKALPDLSGHADEVSALAFTADGKTLASGSHDRTVKLWCVPALAQVASLEGHVGKVHCLAFSPDGTVLATGGDSGEVGEVLLWRAPRD